MNLADFIRENRIGIVAEWQDFARTLSPAPALSSLQLNDHIDAILSFIARDIESAQTAAQQVQKSRGAGINRSAADTAAQIHGNMRHDEGYDIIEMVAEYRALRASVIKLWTASKTHLSDTDMVQLTRFNEAIDQALAESVATFTFRVEQSRDLLLGVLGHDIRSPLSAVLLGNELLPRLGELNERQTTLIGQIASSALRVVSIVNNLLVLTKARLGPGLSLTKSEFSLSGLIRKISAEVGLQNPDRPLSFECDGDICGDWDETRLGQAVSNLLSNAMRYGAAGTKVSLRLVRAGNSIIFSVHNHGEPIPPEHLDSIFACFTRQGSEVDSSTNLGLGLFITRDIVTAHEGSVEVTSTAAEGTTFTVRLPG